MDTLKDGGPAFPADPDWLDPKTIDESRRMAAGMPLRDCFAAQALVGWLASTDTRRNPLGVADLIAAGCYELADAMLRARGEA
ncbi:hypothetical protein DF153_21175 [Burkholderia cenocepacia]|nr:hypothetical protein DF152_12845 [Burkholderia cenocepacia]RQU21018.1 hypothetical protein DF153_21175 [Burkholderia cenocepacia]